MKKRIDQLLVEKGLFDSRAKAQAAIMAGQILANEQKIDKAGTSVDETSAIRILGNKLPYVSRGGLKLEKALAEFQIDTKDRICLDIGASTGGFTDCLLQKGAKKVYAVDVGYGQMDIKIRNDKRVVVIERTNVRYLTPEDLYGKEKEPASLCVIDVSFISLAKIFPALKDLLSKDADIIALVKPQFESGREHVEKGGIVRDPEVHQKVLNNVEESAKNNGLNFAGSTGSPITGADGNVEFLIHLIKA